MRTHRTGGHGHARQSRILFLLYALPLLLLLMGCLPSVDGRPKRLFPVQEETATLRQQVIDLQREYYDSPASPTVAARNEIIAERMAAIDMNYYVYEEALTRERQDVGFFSSLASIGLTTTATLIPVEQTKNVLTGISTGLLGATQAYSNEVLFQKTVQVLQAQMRANRAKVATQIISRMSQGLDQYPLAMAMSDLEQYYAAGTISAGLIGASETVGQEASLREGEKADAVLRFKFSIDRSAEILTKYLYPDGPTGKRNEEHAARLTALLRARGIKGHLAVILRDPGAAKTRQQLVKDAGLN